MLQPETKAEVSGSIFKILSRTLQLQNFVKLEPEAQRLTLEETRSLLFDGSVLPVNKRALICYLSDFSEEKTSSEVMAIVQSIFDAWHDDPL